MSPRDPHGSTLSCTLLCGASVVSLAQLFTGFALLERSGAVEVTLKDTRGTPLPGNWWGMGMVTAAGQRVVYDTGDGPQLNADALAWCDHYFKRSYSAAVAAHVDDPRVRPLGLNYAVYSRGDWRVRRTLLTARTVRRTTPRLALSTAVRLSRVLSSLTGDTFGRALCQVEAFESPPAVRRDAKVFRIARTWDPAALAGAPEQAEHWAAVNRQRANVVRALRQELGERFIGGLVPTPDARRDYPDCLVPDERWTKRKTFLSLMHQSDVCVTSEGIGECVPWSLTEYVAASRAIVSEPPRSVLPGPFAAERNYLPYATADECVEAVVALLDDDERRLAMMEANQAYYRSHVRPDRLVWNTLELVTGRAPPSGAGPTAPA
jgi:hypothetical protein